MRMHLCAYMRVAAHSRRSIAGFLGDGVNFILEIQSHCANMTFSDKVDMIGFSGKLHMK